MNNEDAPLPTSGIPDLLAASTQSGSMEAENDNADHHDRRGSSSWLAVTKTLNTKRSCFTGAFLFLCVLGGTLALLIPSRSSGDSQAEALALKDRYFTFRTTLDKYSEPWTFVLPSSPQRRAFQWLVFEDKTLKLDPIDETRLVQRYALLTLFYACVGNNWSGVFASEPPLDEQYDRNECDFPGVECDDSGFVVKFLPTKSRLVGTIPAELGLLSHLTHLDMTENELEGSIPRSLFEKLSNLEVLVMDGNRLGSTVPPEIGSLTKLTSVSVKNNRFTGVVPSSLSNLKSLVYLDMSLNPSLSGEILNYVGSWPNLEFLDILRSPFTGSLPSTISQLDSLTNLVFGPGITGALPLTLSKLTELKTLYIIGSEISGPFPDISKMRNLNRLVLENTMITGSIPKSIAQLEDLLELVLADSSAITGSLPTEIGLLSNLQTMVLNGMAKLSGPLPSEIVMLPNLKLLSVGGTRLSGTVPNSLCESGAFDNDSSYPCSLVCECCLTRCESDLSINAGTP